MIPVGYSGVLPPMEHLQLIYVNKDDDDPSASRGTKRVRGREGLIVPYSLMRR
jgi:hypothetical protein